MSCFFWLSIALVAGCADRNDPIARKDSDVSPAQVQSTARNAGARTVVVLVAASAKDAIEEIAEGFEAKHDATVKISPGPSNTLAAQIAAGAPADLFLSAHEDWVAVLRGKELVSRSEPLLANDLVLIVPSGNPAGIAQLSDLQSDNVKKLALAGENVPAGMYAAQALTAANLYQSLLDDGRIARGQDVRVTLSYVERGEAEAGIVYATDAKISQHVEVVLTFDPATYDKIVYPLVLLTRGDENDAARRLYEYLQSAAAAAVFEKYGFQLLKQSE